MKMKNVFFLFQLTELPLIKSLINLQMMTNNNNFKKLFYANVGYTVIMCNNMVTLDIGTRFLN